MLQRRLVLALLPVFLIVILSSAVEPSADLPALKLLIAFASYRERPLHPRIHFYEHDGVTHGKLSGAIETVNQRSDYRPCLSADGRWCAFASELENQTGRILLWDLKEKKLVDPPTLNDSPQGQMYPSLSADGQWLAFSAWGRPGSSQRWDLFLYSLADKKLIDLPGVNTPNHDERLPALSGNGRWLAFVTNQKDGRGLSDIWLHDRQERKTLPLAELNSPHLDADPWLSSDGRLLAFVSDRPGGSGGRDVFLYDLHEQAFVPLPGLNSPGHEQSPSLSPDGRFIVFVSERIEGAGERDIYLYDRQTQRLLPTPELNARQEDLDPCIVVLSE